jgi:hypothetical protein
LPLISGLVRINDFTKRNQKSFIEKEKTKIVCKIIK